MTFALQRFNLGRILGGVVILWALICKRFAIYSTQLTFHLASRHADCRRDILEGTLRSTFLPRIRRERHPDRLHVHRKRILYARGAGFTAELVVQLYGAFHDSGGRVELWICADHRRGFEEVAVHISARGLLDILVWYLLFLRSELAGRGMVPDQGGEDCCCGEAEEGTDGGEVPENQNGAGKGGIFGCEAVACVYNDGVSVYGKRCSKWIRPVDRSHVWMVDTGVDSLAIPSRGPLLTSDSGVRLGVITIPGYSYHATDSELSTGHGWVCNDLEGQLDVPRWYAGCGLQHHWDIWCCGELDDCDWHEVRDERRLLGQGLMCVCSNVAGATKKSCMAAAIFVAYCVGNIVGPQLIKSERKKDHYPELWTGLIIW